MVGLEGEGKGQKGWKSFSVSGQEEMEEQVLPLLDQLWTALALQILPQSRQTQAHFQSGLGTRSPTGNCCHLTAESSVTDGFPCWRGSRSLWLRGSPKALMPTPP